MIMDYSPDEVRELVYLALDKCKVLPVFKGDESNFLTVDLNYDTSGLDGDSDPIVKRINEILKNSYVTCTFNTIGDCLRINGYFIKDRGIDMSNSVDKLISTVLDQAKIGIGLHWNDVIRFYSELYGWR